MAKKSLKSHVTKKKNSKIKLYYATNDGYRDLNGNYYTHAEGIQLIQDKKAVLPEWKAGKKNKPTYEGDQYRGGRKKDTPNLVKLDGGNIRNQHGVVFTQEDKKRLESAVNTANRNRVKMYVEEGELDRYKAGKKTGQKVKNLQAMGKESDFIISRKSKSLQQFKSREHFERYMDNLQRVNSPTYIDDRLRLYKRNHMKALENVFGDEAKDVVMKIRMMKPKDYMKLIQSDEDLEVSYIYDPSALHGKLNNIRRALGMNTKEEPV